MAGDSCLLYHQYYDIVLFPMQALGRPDSQFYGWRILFAVPLVFALFQVATLPWCPESPRFLLIKKRKEEEAVKGL